MRTYWIKTKMVSVWKVPENTVWGIRFIRDHLGFSINIDLGHWCLLVCLK